MAGWAAAVEEDARRGLEQLRAGLEMLRSTGAEIRLPFYHGLLAEVFALNGNIGEALANLSTAFAFQNKNGGIWCSADLHATHGDLLLHSKNAEQARQSYRNAVEAALRVGSVTFVRACPSLDSGQRSEASCSRGCGAAARKTRKASSD